MGRYNASPHEVYLCFVWIMVRLAHTLHSKWFLRFSIVNKLKMVLLGEPLLKMEEGLQVIS